MCRYDIVFAGDYNCYPDDRLADWFPVPENRPESVMRCACVALTSQRGVVLIKHVSSSRRIRGGKSLHADARRLSKRMPSLFWQAWFKMGA